MLRAFRQWSSGVLWIAGGASAFAAELIVPFWSPNLSPVGRDSAVLDGLSGTARTRGRAFRDWAVLGGTRRAAVTFLIARRSWVQIPPSPPSKVQSGPVRAHRPSAFATRLLTDLLTGRGQLINAVRRWSRRQIVDAYLKGRRALVAPRARCSFAARGWASANVAAAQLVLEAVEEFEERVADPFSISTSSHTSGYNKDLCVTGCPWRVDRLLLAPTVRLSASHGRAVSRRYPQVLDIRRAGRRRVALLVASGADQPESGASDAVNVFKVIIGLLFFAIAAKQWRGRPAPGENPPLPAWMSTIDTVTSGKSFAFGGLLSGLNPKNLALTAATAASIAQVDLSGWRDLAAVAVQGAKLHRGVRAAHEQVGDPTDRHAPDEYEQQDHECPMVRSGPTESVEWRRRAEPTSRADRLE